MERSDKTQELAALCSAVQHVYIRCTPLQNNAIQHTHAQTLMDCDWQAEHNLWSLDDISSMLDQFQSNSRARKIWIPETERKRKTVLLVKHY